MISPLKSHLYIVETFYRISVRMKQPLFFSLAFRDNFIVLEPTTLCPRRNFSHYAAFVQTEQQILCHLNLQFVLSILPLRLLESTARLCLNLLRF